MSIFSFPNCGRTLQGNKNQSTVIGGVTVSVLDCQKRDQGSNPHQGRNLVQEFCSNSDKTSTLTLHCQLRQLAGKCISKLILPMSDSLITKFGPNTSSGIIQFVVC